MEMLDKKTKKTLQFIDNLTELAAMPTITMDIYSLLNDPRTNIKQIVKKIELDPAIAAFILKSCNSPIYGIKKTVRSISQAVNLLGYTSCKSVLLTYFLKNLYQISEKKYIANYLWEHAVSVAIAAKALTGTLGMKGDNETAYLAGLLHDIGKLILYIYDNSGYEKIIHTVDSDLNAFADLESEAYGYTHSEAGYYLVEKWGFDDLFKYTVRFHHTPAAEAIYPEYRSVVLANELVHFYIDKQKNKLKFYLDSFGIKERELTGVVDSILATIMESTKIIGDE